MQVIQSVAGYNAKYGYKQMLHPDI